MPTSPRGSRSCAGRNRRCGDRKRSAAWSRSTGRARSGPAVGRRREAGSFGCRAACRDVSRRQRATGASRRGARLAARRRHRQLRRGGDRDGYRNLSGRARGQAERASPAVEVGASGFALARRERVRRLRSRSPSSAPTRSTAAATAWPRGGCGRRLGTRRSAWRGTLSASPARLVATAIARRRRSQPDRGRRTDARRPSSSIASPPAQSSIC